MEAYIADKPCRTDLQTWVKAARKDYHEAVDLMVAWFKLREAYQQSDIAQLSSTIQRLLEKRSLREVKGYDCIIKDFATAVAEGDFQKIPLLLRQMHEYTTNRVFEVDRAS